MAKIMLVEDDNNLREIYGARLQAEGHTVVSAKDGEEALAMAVKERPDLIISDVMMPRISGFDMLDILRNAPETKNTKVIMMTALSQVEDKTRAEKLGADRYLVKSQATLEDVVATVKDVLGTTEQSPQAPAEDSVPASPTTQPNAEVAQEVQPTAPQPSPEPSTPISLANDTSSTLPSVSTEASTEAPEVQPTPPSTNSEAPQPTKIDVVEPPQEVPSPPEVVLPAPPSEATTPTPAPEETTTPPQEVVATMNQPTQEVGPNVDQVLTNEANAPGTTSPVTNSPATDAEHQNKIINPINEPTQTPDFNELLAKEEAIEQSNADPQTQAPQPQQAPQPNPGPTKAIDPNSIAL